MLNSLRNKVQCQGCGRDHAPSKTEQANPQDLGNEIHNEKVELE